MLTQAAAVVAGLALLTWAADRFILGAASIARAAKISPLVIGMTIVGMGTSSPEFFISTLAAFQDNAGLAIGNAVGSNICNIALILGVCALIRPLVVRSSILHRELPLCLATAVLLLMLLLDGTLDRVDGVVLAAALAALIVWMLRSARAGRGDALESEMVQELPPELPASTAIFWLLLGLVMLLGASQLLLWGAVGIARGLGVSDLVIGLTIVAVGTSLPELAASVTGTLKGEDDIAIGNVLGSNLFNIVAILLPPAWIAPSAQLERALLLRDVPIMIGVTALLFVFAYGWRGRPSRINRWNGAVFVALFAAYTLILLSTSTAS